MKSWISIVLTIVLITNAGIVLSEDHEAGHWDHTITLTAPPEGYIDQIPLSIDGVPITAIGNRCFCENENIHRIILHSGIDIIGDYAFADSSLEEIEIQYSQGISIGDGAFQATNITAVTLPHIVNKIGTGVFSSCYDLKQVQLSEYMSELPPYTFAECIALEEIVLPDSIVRIGESALAACSVLTNVKLSSKLTYIGESAFEDCDSLESIVLPDGLRMIDSYAFASCEKLTSVYLPPTIVYIAPDAFEDCPCLILQVDEGSYPEYYAAQNQINHMLVNVQ